MIESWKKNNLNKEGVNKKRVKSRESSITGKSRKSSITGKSRESSITGKSRESSKPSLGIK